MARVLVVDDDPPVRALLRAILTVNGHEVVEAHDGESAVETIGSEAFDLVLLDLMLPGMSGYDVLERLQDLPGGNEVKVIVVSALDSDDGRGLREAMLGTLEHVTKPFGSRDIEEAVEIALDASAEERREMRARAAEIYDETFKVARRLRGRRSRRSTPVGP